MLGGGRLDGSVKTAHEKLYDAWAKFYVTSLLKVFEPRIHLKDEDEAAELHAHARANGQRLLPNFYQLPYSQKRLCPDCKGLGKTTFEDPQHGHAMWRSCQTCGGIGDADALP